MIALLLAVAAAHERYDAAEAPRAAELLAQAVRFATVAGNDSAQAAQKEWLLRTAAALDLSARDAGMVTEIELPGPAGAPVLGLMVHGDVQPVDEKAWTVPPFAGVVRDGRVWGRGAADDKGPMVQALLALAALKEAGPARTHTVRLLVGSDEESGSSDLKSYLQTHEAPAFSLVLDSEFPVVVGEKAWDGLTVSADPIEREAKRPWTVASLEAGLAPSIVPDRARLVLRWRAGQPDWKELVARLVAKAPPAGTRLEVTPAGAELEVLAHGRAAHAGVNLRGGRNALFALSRGEYIQWLDAAKYTRIVQRLILDTVLDFLKEKGVDTSAYQESANAIISNSYTIHGDVGSMATGSHGRAEMHVNRASGSTAGSKS